MRGLLITFEGTEGSGKSSQLEILARHLRRKGFDVVKTREPGGTGFGEQVRNLLLDVKNRRLDPRTELFLYLASRTQHLEEVILPALRSGKIVLCDRYSDATIAYQGFGRRLDMKIVRIAVDYAAKNIRPDRTFLLDLDVRKGLARVKARGRRDRMDREKMAFHERVRRGYLWLARTHKRRIHRIRASMDMGRVAREIREGAEQTLKRVGFKTDDA